MAFTDNIKEIAPAVSEIKNNTPVLIVGDKVLVGGIGGNFIPAGQGGSATSMDFYKCSAVYSDSTWSGYKAVLNNGEYSFQSESTGNLTYGFIVPEVGKVYSADAFVKAELWTGIPYPSYIYDGESYTDAVTGIAGTNNGTTLVPGKHGNAYHLTNSTYINTNQTMFNGKNEAYVSAWVKYGDSLSFPDGRDIICQPGNGSYVSYVEFCLDENGRPLLWLRNQGSGLIYQGFSPIASTWVHVLYGFTSTKILIAVNGIVETFNQNNATCSTNGYNCYIGCNGQLADHAGGGELTIDELYIWENLTLTDAQFSQMATALYNNGNGKFLN